jgi:phosphoribosylformimino-5-aminoimidazole carboxamide ribotide isomerase
LRQWLAELTPARLVVGVDVRAGRVLTRGWEQETTMGVQVFCAALVESGVERVLFTDVNRDGTLEGPNVDAIKQLVQQTNLQVIASGGVGSLEHVLALAASGAESVIIGKALYDGRLRLADALRVASETTETTGQSA